MNQRNMHRMISFLIEMKGTESLFSKKHFFFVSCLLCCLIIKADNVTLTFDQNQLIVDSELNLEVFSVDTTRITNVKFKRGKVILFTVFTGLFGGHRIYLGTHQRTPILYSITLGGLGILPFIDLINIILTKDLSTFENVPQIIMWGR